MKLTLDQLEVLEAIDRFGGFGAAAKNLHRATSAVSYAVKSLESALGVALFERTGRKVRLTEAGRTALELGRNVLERSRQLERLGDDLRQGWEPELRVIVDGVLPQAPLAAATRAFLDEPSTTKVQLHVEYLSGVRRRFDRAAGHFMLGVELRPDERLVTQVLPPVPMHLLVHRTHPLARLRKPINRAALHAHVEVLVPDSGERDGWPPSGVAFVGSARAVEVADFALKREALLGGVGFGWLPEHLCRGDLECGELVPVQFEEGNRYALQPLLARRGDVPLGPAAQHMLRQLERAFAKGK